MKGAAFLDIKEKQQVFLGPFDEWTNGFRFYALFSIISVRTG